MAVFIITDKGKTLQAKVLAGECQFEFTKMAVGDGYVSSSKDYATMNDLQNRKVDIDISLILADGAKCSVSGVLSNAAVTEAFYVREAGLYAKDPDEGEILFCAHYYDMPSAVDSASGGSYAKEFTFEIGIDDAEDVNITVPQTGLMTKADVEALIALAMKNAILATGVNDGK